MTLYNAKVVESAFRITKFDENFDVESSYITTRSTCECPAGVRDSCRHRQMFPEFEHSKRADTGWFLDWDERKWYYYNSETGLLTEQAPRAVPAWRRL